jgi:hypothetical protein
MFDSIIDRNGRRSLEIRPWCLLPMEGRCATGCDADHRRACGSLAGATILIMQVPLVTRA